MRFFLKKTASIFWFRQDLRLNDNPGLIEAVKHGSIIPIYILDDKNSKEHKMGAASRLWLHYSLIQLNEQLGSQLIIAKGEPEEILTNICKQEVISKVFWNRVYEPWCIKRDKRIKENLTKQNIEVKSFNSSLLWEPWDVLKGDGTPYKVFTPYFRRGCLSAPFPRRPLSKPEKIIFYKTDNLIKSSINDLNLLPNHKWKDELLVNWKIGEKEAISRLTEFIDFELNDYKEGRNFPTKKNVSRLSPYLHWGEISPNTVWYAVKDRMDLGIGNTKDSDHFLSEIGWREFSYTLLFYFPELPKENLQKRFNKFPWKFDEKKLLAWKKGMTGYPIVDAGMRELWSTGYMHNRLRMIVGSFLVKNLLIHWHEGEKWFWDCLLDADLANNSASWQWIAGCGADAAPYFRIFNPITQGLKFDSEGIYIRKFIPEIANLPNKYIFNPWEAPKEVLEKANVQLGDNYPNPIINLKSSREEALLAFSKLKTLEI